MPVGSPMTGSGTQVWKATLKALHSLSCVCREYAKLANYFDNQVKLQQQEADLCSSQLSRDEMAFRLGNQLKPTTREWDLNRPDALLIDQPARVGDNDSRLGPSSIQARSHQCFLFQN